MQTLFAHCVSACGLTLDEAATYLGQARSTVGKKSAGAREMVTEDGLKFAALWHRIRTGDVDGLPEGARTMSHALRLLRGVETIGRRPTGRKLGSKNSSKQIEQAAA